MILMVIAKHQGRVSVYFFKKPRSGYCEKKGEKSQEIRRLFGRNLELVKR